ncbi:hypothetical protein N7456_010052 [Penicillium angulare]|uniref:Uncharacterized protein n=1 Tax=Penicillium angulare TaxID=116970 RepID=A0A9W9F5W8_9EURO|nr:hypothetical protein N7456_010052 [Penicillium angulare]
MYFVAHDIMSRTTSDSWPEDETLHLWYDDENLEEILRSRSLTRYEVQKYASISSEVGKSLLSLKQRFSEQSEGKKGLQRVAQIKHAAALLYLTERFGPKKGKCASTCFPTCFPASLTAMEWELEDIGLQRSADQENISRANHQTSGPQSDTSTANYHKPLGDITGQEYKGICAICKVKLITSMIELISTLPDMATLLWPLFVLGNVGLENEEQRRFVIDRLANIQRTQNLGSVRRTIDAVKHAFGTKELLPSNERSWGHETYHYISLA